MNRLSNVLTAVALAALVAAPTRVAAQDSAEPGGPPLASFAAIRVAIIPVQLWRADSVGWSREVTWATLRLSLDSAIAETLRERGMGTRWAYASDVVRSARRNPIYTSDPYALGVGRWRALPPKVGDDLSALVADNLRPITALGDTRHALIPVELRVEGEFAILRLVLVDTRARKVVWAGDFGVAGTDGWMAKLAGRVADLVVEP